jgi:hypothetical protein
LCAGGGQNSAYICGGIRVCRASREALELHVLALVLGGYLTAAAALAAAKLAQKRLRELLITSPNKKRKLAVCVWPRSFRGMRTDGPVSVMGMSRPFCNARFARQLRG